MLKRRLVPNKFVLAIVIVAMLAGVLNTMYVASNKAKYLVTAELVSKNEWTSVETLRSYLIGKGFHEEGDTKAQGVRYVEFTSPTLRYVNLFGVRHEKVRVSVEERNEALEISMSVDMAWPVLLAP